MRAGTHTAFEFSIYNIQNHLELAVSVSLKPGLGPKSVLVEDGQVVRDVLS